MKKFHLILCFISGALALTGAPMPPIENFDDWGAPPAVNGNTDHVICRQAAKNPLLNTPDDSSAGRLTDPGHDWQWAPVWHRDGAGGIQIPWLTASTDLSMLAVAESIGDKRGPNSTLVLLFNQYTGHIGRMYLWEERKFTHAQWLPGTDLLLAAEAPQPELKRPARLVTLNLATGQIAGESPPLPAPVDALTADYFASGGKLYHFVSSDWQMREVMALPPGRVAIAAGTGGIYLATRDGLSLLDAAGKTLCQWPWGAEREIALLVPGADDTVLAIGSDERAALLFGGALTMLDDPVIAARWLPEEKAFAVAWRKKQLLELLSPDGAPTGIKGRPQIGTARDVIALPGSDFAVFNQTGELHRLTPARRSIRPVTFY